MERPTMTALLKAEEETTRNQLRADDAVDRSRKQSADRLNEQLGQMLLRYNAAWSGDGRRQALADSMTAVVQDMLPLLTAGTAVKEIPKRKVRTGGVVLLLFAVIFALLCVILVRQYYPVGCAFLALAAVCGFLAGLLWHGEREVLVHAGLDPEIVWKTLLKTVETMDRKTESFLQDEAAAAAADIVSPAGRASPTPRRCSFSAICWRACIPETATLPCASFESFSPGSPRRGSRRATMRRTQPRCLIFSPPAAPRRPCARPCSRRGSFSPRERRQSVKNKPRSSGALDRTCLTEGNGSYDVLLGF